MSDTENDEDLRRAIALSLMSPDSVARKDLLDDEEDDDDLDKPQSCSIISARTHQTLLQPKHLLPSAQGDVRPIAASLLGLNRRQMENERLARTALRERGDDASSRKRKASTSPNPSHDRFRRQSLEPKSSCTTTARDWPRGSEAPEIGASQSPKPTILPSDSGPKIVEVISTTSQQPFTKGQAGAPRPSGVQYPEGIVKKTWALGHDRNGDDIKIEEVLQKSDLEVAVLSSFQVDADCTSFLTFCLL